MCGESVKSKGHRPFCSSRCRQLDLGQWLDGTYRIPGPPAESTADTLPTRDDEEEPRWDA